MTGGGKGLLALLFALTSATACERWDGRKSQGQVDAERRAEEQKAQREGEADNADGSTTSWQRGGEAGRSEERRAGEAAGREGKEEKPKREEKAKQHGQAVPPSPVKLKAVEKKPAPSERRRRYRPRPAEPPGGQPRHEAHCSVAPAKAGDLPRRRMNRRMKRPPHIPISCAITSRGDRNVCCGEYARKFETREV